MKDAKAALKRAETLAAPSTTKKSAPKNRRVVTRYMGSGIRVPGSGSKTQDPGSQVMGSGSAIFCVSLRDQGLSFSDTSLLMRN